MTPLKNEKSYRIFAVLIVIICALVSSIQNLTLGTVYVFDSDIPYTYYNNFVIFRESFLNLLSNKNLYALYPASYDDLFKYSPAFALFMAPFQLLPVWAGLFFWNLSGGLLLYGGLRKLVFRNDHLLMLMVLLIPETFTTMSNSQSNTHIAGLLLYAFGALEKEQLARASLYIALTVFIKLFTLAIVPVLLFYPGWIRAGLWFAVWFVLLAFIPAIVTGFANLAEQYQHWLDLLKADRHASSGLGIQGMLEAFTGRAINKNAVLVSGAILLLLPLGKIKACADPRFRLIYFSFALIWMVLFNHRAESPTFVLVICGVLLFAHAVKYNRTAVFFLVACIIFTSLSVTDLVPYDIRNNFVEVYRVKSVFPSLLLLYMAFLLLRWKDSGERSGAEQFSRVLQS